VAIPFGFEPPEALPPETFEVSEGGRLVIGAWAGSVNVSAGSRGTVRVEVRCRGVLPPPPLEIERDGDDVYVAGRSAPLHKWLSRWAWRELHLEVSVPARYSVDVETHGGRVEIHGVDGEVEARSRKGHLVFRNVRGPIDGRTWGGSIDVSGCCGDVDVATWRGSIEIRNAEGRVSAHARGGRIAVLDAAGEMVLRSGGGSIRPERSAGARLVQTKVLAMYM
jgi:hypothetical protein